MHISIETVKGKSINLDVEDRSETIDLKIHGPIRQLVLRLGPEPVPDPVMRIFITTLTGKTLNLEVNQSDTIGEVKDKYEKKEDVPVDMQRLYFQGNMLEDSLILADYNIRNESTLHMRLNLCGC